MRIWVAGSIAWDTVLYIDKVPSVGGFTHAKLHQERPGGQALNIAAALNETGLQTALVGYLGNDEFSNKLIEFAETHTYAQVINFIDHPTPHVVVLVDENGERTMIGMEQSHFDQIKLPIAELESEDIVVWPVWRECFTQDLNSAREKGCRTIVGIGALKQALNADIAVGSSKELSTDFEIEKYLQNIPRIIVTDSDTGAIEYSAAGKIQIASKAKKVIDTTGAGDAFLCGIIKVLAEQGSQQKALEVATKWAALAVASKSSIPPAFTDN